MEGIIFEEEYIIEEFKIKDECFTLFRDYEFYKKIEIPFVGFNLYKRIKEGKEITEKLVFFIPIFSIEYLKFKDLEDLSLEEKNVFGIFENNVE